MTGTARTGRGLGLISRIGSFSFRHPFVSVAIWLMVLAGGVLSAGKVFAGLDSSQGPKSMESVQAYTVLDQDSKDGGTVIGVVDHVDPHAAAVQQQVTATATTLAGISGVREVSTPYTTGGGDNVSTDGHAIAIKVKLDDLDHDAIGTVVDQVRTDFHGMVDKLHAGGAPDATVSIGGDPVINIEANHQVQHDLSLAEELSLPLTLIVLVFVFGGLLAALLPVLAAVIAVTGSMLVLLGFAQVTSLDSDSVTVVTLLGLGLSIDYGLLLVGRYREELAHGCTPTEAVARAWATAGRTIVFSALTVAAALGGLLMFGVSDLAALGAAGIAIALTAMVVALTFTAALLGLFKKRIKPSKRAMRRAGATPSKGFFARLAGAVQKRPAIVTVLVAAALLVGGAPLLSAKLQLNDLSGVPRSLESARTADIMAQRFGERAEPSVTVVARTDAAHLDAWAAGLSLPNISKVYPATQVGPNLSVIQLDAPGGPQGSQARDLVTELRAHRPDDGQSWVTGNAALLTDVLHRLVSRLPGAIGVTLAGMFLLLFLMTGSVVVPLKAILMNVFSLGATFGVVYLIFVHGFLAGPLHVLQVPGLNPFTIVAVFAFAFALSMDYEVFLLARIKEYVDSGEDTSVAVRHGLQRSGRIITSAALLMVIVFGCFLAGRMATVQQIGLGLALAVAIDATIVRCVLVPATMTLLGKWNWWAPRPLRSLQRRFGFGERTLPAPATPAVTPTPTREPAPVG
jgi:putative drug exporter of the RND superfamily